MREGFQEANFEAIAGLWRRFFPAPYHLPAATLRRHTVQHPLFDWGGSCLDVSSDGEIRGALAIKKSATPALYEGQDPDAAHITALVFSDPVVAVDLLGYAKRVLYQRGVQRLVFGQDGDHLFPGCPEDVPALKSVLVVEGFDEGPPVYDMEVEVSRVSPPAAVPGDAEMRPATPEDVHLIHEFLAREFPGRWRYDVIRKCIDDGEAGGIFCAFQGGEAAGFAMTQTAECQRPIGGALWHGSLGPKWAAIGPVGVAKAMRGKGLGLALMQGALCHLKEQGRKRAVVDWTGITGFYERLGFEVWRTYSTFQMPLMQPKD